MANHAGNIGVDESIYYTVIIGAGIAGLTTAYMLRDKKTSCCLSRKIGLLWATKL